MNNTLILNKIKIAKNLSTDTELAKFLEISKYVLSKWRSRGTLDIEKVLTKCTPIDFNWLFDENTEEVINIDKSVLLSLDNIKTDNDLVNFILEKYKAMAIEYGYMKKELETLKQTSKE